jgi:hypothetical protein
MGIKIDNNQGYPLSLILCLVVIVMGFYGADSVMVWGGLIAFIVILLRAIFYFKKIGWDVFWENLISILILSLIIWVLSLIF